MADFNNDIRQFITTDTNHANNFNEVNGKLLENTVKNKEDIEALRKGLDETNNNLANNYTANDKMNDILSTAVKGDKGDIGIGLDYNWDDTKLGVKREDETDYQYVDLKGDTGSIEHLDEILDKKIVNCVNIKDYGAIGDGVTNCSDCINNAITYAKQNKRGGIYIPTGVYIIDKPIMLYDDVNVYGDGSSSILKQKDNTEIEAVMIVNSSYGDQPNYSTRLENYNITLKDFRIDGNRQNNITYADSTFTNNNGIILKGTHYSFISRVTIENCGRDGFILTDNGSGDWNGHCSTNEFIQVNIIRSGRYNLFIDELANDNVFTNCNFGNSLIDNMNIVGGSNTFFSCIIWGANCRGVTIGAQQNSFRGCNIEGNGHHGIYFAEYGHHSCISNCKFMANGKAEPNVYSHVYLGGHADTICKDIIISDCIFMGSSEFADGSGLTKTCIEMNEYHECVSLSNNSIYYNSQGTKFELEKQHVLGLKEKDILNGIIIINSKNRPTRDNTPLGAIYIEEDTGKMVYYDVVNYKWITLDTVPTSLPANGGNANTVNNQSFAWEFGNGNPTHIWGRANGEETNKVFSPSQITVGTANKLSNTLTLQVGGYLAGSFNGSEGKIIDIPVATTSTLGVMSAEQVSQLETNTNDIASLKQSVADGKQAVINAIDNKIGYTSGLTTANSGVDYAWWITNKILISKNLNIENPVDLSDILASDNYHKHCLSAILNKTIDSTYGGIHILRCSTGNSVADTCKVNFTCLSGTISIIDADNLAKQTLNTGNVISNTLRENNGCLFIYCPLGASYNITPFDSNNFVDVSLNLIVF